jgi:hypothetical protein
MRSKNQVVTWQIYILGAINGLFFGLIAELVRQWNNSHIRLVNLENAIINGTEVIDTVDMLYWHSIPIVSVILLSIATTLVHYFFVNRAMPPIIIWQIIGLTTFGEVILLSLCFTLTKSYSLDMLYSSLERFISNYSKPLLLLLVSIAFFNLIYGLIIELSSSYYHSNKT